MPERLHSLEEIAGKDLFPAPEDIQRSLDVQSRDNQGRETREMRPLESVRIRGGDEMMLYQHGYSRMIQDRTRSLNRMEGVELTENNGIHSLLCTTPNGEQISIFAPEMRLAGEGGSSYSSPEAQAEFKKQWEQLPEKFRQAYQEYVNWSYSNKHTGIELDVLQDMKKINPVHADQIRELAKKPDLVVLGAKNVDWNKQERNFYWAVMDKKQP